MDLPLAIHGVIESVILTCDLTTESLAKRLQVRFELTCEEFTIYKGPRVTSGSLAIREGELTLLGEVSYIPPYESDGEDFGNILHVDIVCPAERFQQLAAMRSELVGANLSFELVAGQSAIYFASLGPDDDDFCFDLRNGTRIPITKFSIRFPMLGSQH